MKIAMAEKYIWLFGENNANTCNNNSFYFWRYVVLKSDNIEKYFILEENDQNKKIIKQIEPDKRKYIVWKNSIKHYLLYRKADMFFVTLSYKDIAPSKVLWKSITPKVIKPVIYLQHGTLGMKRLGYSGKSYNNNMFRFMIYNRKILEQYEKENNFKKYQLHYAEYHPRYQELLLKNDQYQKSKDPQQDKQILWFITWREYLGQKRETQKLLTLLIIIN